jgi:hypothetical protein
MFLAKLIDGYLLSADAPEPLILLAFGMSLVVATVGLRRLLNRYDEVKQK